MAQVGRAGTFRVCQFIQKSTSLLSWCLMVSPAVRIHGNTPRQWFPGSGGGGQSTGVSRGSEVPRWHLGHSGIEGRGQCPRKATRTKPCRRSNPCPSPFSLDKPGIPPEQDTGPWRGGSQLRSPHCSSPLSSTQPWSQLFVPSVPYSFDKFIFFLVLMLL